MRITNLNPDTGIGASSWFAKMDGFGLLMDAGTHPELEGREGLPLYSRIQGERVDVIALSHCHHDHVGSLPIALRHFRQAQVVMSEGSYYILERVLHNSVNVMARQRQELGIAEYPLYSHEEVERICGRFNGCKYRRPIPWASLGKGKENRHWPALEFYDAGHVMGSAGLWVSNGAESLFYTGDVCFHPQTLQGAAEFGDVKADILIMETTRGDRPAPPGVTRQTELRRLGQALEGALREGRSVLIPSFALGRTQEILAHLALMMGQGAIARRPIYISGLGRVFTEIYDQKAHLAPRQHPDLQLTQRLELIVLEREQLAEMKLGGGQIFVLTAGMMTENSASHDLALRIMGQARHAIYFVGYADPDTPGGRLKSSKEGEPFFFSNAAPDAVRRCEMEDFDLTAHANREALVDFVGSVSPRVVLLGHGGAASRHWVEEQIRSQHPNIRVIQPHPGMSFEV